MSYSFAYHPECKREIIKASKKNPVLREAIEGKVSEIINNPDHYKPLSHELSGERRVHILKSFVLRFEIDESRKLVTFIAFKHHDEAYRR